MKSITKSKLQLSTLLVIFFTILSVGIWFGIIRTVDRQIIATYSQLTNLYSKVQASDSILKSEPISTDLTLQMTYNILATNVAILNSTYLKWLYKSQLPSSWNDYIIRPFHLLKYQLKCNELITELKKLGEKNGIKLESNVWDGFPQFSHQMLISQYLWLRLFLTQKLLETAIVANPERVITLKQILDSDAAQQGPLFQFDFYIELEGRFRAIETFLKMLYCSEEELVIAGFPMVSNKPPFLCSRVLIQKADPNKPDVVKMQALLHGFVTVNTTNISHDAAL